MLPLPVVFAKLAGLQRILVEKLKDQRSMYFDPLEVLEYFKRYASLHAELVKQLPELYSDLPLRNIPKAEDTTDYEGRGYVRRPFLNKLFEDIDYIFEVRAHSELATPITDDRPMRIFISHGRSEDWQQVQAFIEHDLSLQTLELAQEPNLGRTVLQKLEEESDKCSYAVVVMTGDDEPESGSPHARGNVLHEIGYFQAKFGLQNVCLLHEEGTNIPSNIHGLVYIPFPKGNVDSTFRALARELKVVFKK